MRMHVWFSAPSTPGTSLRLSVELEVHTRRGWSHIQREFTQQFFFIQGATITVLLLKHPEQVLVLVEGDVIHKDGEAGAPQILGVRPQRQEREREPFLCVSAWNFEFSFYLIFRVGYGYKVRYHMCKVFIFPPITTEVVGSHDSSSDF